MQGETGKGGSWFFHQPFFDGVNVGKQENDRAVTAEIFHVFWITDNTAPRAYDHIRMGGAMR